MWVIVSSTKADERHPILGDKKYVVGRTGCDITINDPSVSRKQAVLMMAHYEANVVKSFITPSLTVEDTSKFGTFVNGESLKKKPGCLMTLKDGDKIQFGGSPASMFIARYEPFVATTSCLEKVPKKNLQRVMCLLGGHVVRDWRSSCDLLIMAKINVTIKVICAINNQKPIVTPDYLDHFHEFLTGQRNSKPDPKDYLPEVADKEVPAGVSFHPDVRRATLLKDLKFYFLSAHQFNKTNLAVSTAGGQPILLEDGAEEDAEVMTQDGTIVVAVTRDVLSTLSPTCQKFVRTVCLVLKKKNLRMVTDPEIGWAILTCNTDDFCNPKSAITPSMYSSMASQSLSQMTDMDVDISQHVSNTEHTVTQQASNMQPTAARQEYVSCNEMLPPQEPHKTDFKRGKRPASALDKDSDDLFPDKTKIEDSSLLHSPSGKRIKQETQVSPSQQNLSSRPRFETSKKADSSSLMYSAPLFKSPQTPTGVASIDKSSTQSLDDVKMSRTKDSDNFDGNQSSGVKKSGDAKGKKNTKCSSLSLKENTSLESENKLSAGEDLGLSSVLDVTNECDNDSSFVRNGYKQSRTCSPNMESDALLLSNSVHISNKNKSSPCGFLNKKGNSKHFDTVHEDVSDINKESSSSSKSTGTKGKRKKRALFCDSSDEEESVSGGKKGKNSKNTLQNSSDEDIIVLFSSNEMGKKLEHNVRNSNDTNSNEVNKVSEKDSSSSNVIHNGDTETKAAVIKQEDISQLSSTHNGSNNNNIANHRSVAENNASWATVKKEENPRGDELDEEHKVDPDLVLDSDGRPLRHLCQVKVMDLIARVPGSRPGGGGRHSSTSQPSQQQTGVRNFKRFKKTAHCGSNGLPTIIGGRDLEPHKSTRLNHMDDLLEAAVTTENGVREDNGKDGMFSWRDEDLVPKRKGKNT